MSTGLRGATCALTPGDQYITQSARGAYIASVCQSEASFNLSFTAQMINPSERDVKNTAHSDSYQLQVSPQLPCQARNYAGEDAYN
jgi:hypothetical protein